MSCACRGMGAFCFLCDILYVNKSGTTIKDTWTKPRGRVAAGEEGWGGVEGWGENAENCNWTIKMKQNKTKIQTKKKKQIWIKYEEMWIPVQLGCWVHSSLVFAVCLTQFIKKNLEIEMISIQIPSEHCLPSRGPQTTGLAEWPVYLAVYKERVLAFSLGAGGHNVNLYHTIPQNQ